MSNVLKGIIITAVAIPVSIIGINVVGGVIKKCSNNSKKQKDTI